YPSSVHLEREMLDFKFPPAVLFLHRLHRDKFERAGDLEANREKNRYPYILPYDHCRVRLSVQNSNPHTDYINANFVPVRSERDFICTQGPLPNTMADFWRMVWEQNVRIIVMVTSLKQKDTVSKKHSVCVLVCVPTL
uniref:protein-tyrosine-phosphatase n=1 Tax=Labrus bergylta TaxID=56723 RepID=A0A3Q3EU01_9LABR